MSYPRVPIGDLVSLRQGFAINKNTKHHISDESTALPLLRIADMKDKVQNVFVKDTIPAHFIAKPEDIIYTRTGQVGLVFTDQYGVIHNNCFTVTPNDAKTLNRYYLYYVLQSEDFYSAANNLASGAAQSDLPHGAFRSIEIPVPPLASQMRIAEILKGYDDLIENNQKQIKLLEEAAQRLYKEWFIDLRFPGHETTPIVDGAPEGWKKVEVGTCIAKVARTKQVMTAELLEVGKIPVVDQSRNFIAGYINDEDTVVDLGIPIIVFGDHTRVLKYIQFPFAKGADGTQLIVTTNEKMPQSLLYCSLVNVDLSNYHYARHFKYLKAEEILLPSLDVAHQFDGVVSPLFEQVQKLRDKCKLAAEARDRLLPKLMSGEIEV